MATHTLPTTLYRISNCSTCYSRTCFGPHVAHEGVCLHLAQVGAVGQAANQFAVLFYLNTSYIRHTQNTAYTPSCSVPQIAHKGAYMAIHSTTTTCYAQAITQ
jgi:hypothetical protein